jgi:DNA-binding NarL/FixJ family response regulator
MKPLRILIAEDHADVRHSLRALCHEKPQWEVCCEAIDGRDAVEQARRLGPDVALLDVSLPELNGLEAARLIHQESPRIQLLILCMGEADALGEAARRAGADGVALKYDAERVIAWIQSMSHTGNGEVHLAGTVVGRDRHIAAFFCSPDERYDVLGSFVAEGLKHGEKAVHIVNTPDQQSHLDYLARCGVHVDRAASQDQIQLESWEQTYLRTGSFDPQAMTECVQEIFRTSAAASFPLTRLIANMEWVLKDVPGTEALVEYESHINDMMDEIEGVIICAYHAASYDGGLIVDLMRAHPALIVGGVLHSNPFYVAPDVLVDELRQRAR